MEKQDIFDWRRTEEERQPGCSGGSTSEQLGMGLWAGTQQVMTPLHSHQVPQGKPSPPGHRAQMLQIVQGWDKDVCKREIASSTIDKETGSETFCNYRT